jgi:hypothetical protein
MMTSLAESLRTKVLICIGCNVIDKGKESSDEESGDESCSKKF